MIGAFQFDNDGRTYTCRVEEPRGARKEAWWWFGVSGDAHRYAPFQAVAEDTEVDVRSRVIAYYSDLLARRAMPAQARSHWARRTPAAVPATPGPAESPAESPAEAPAQA